MVKISHLAKSLSNKDLIDAPRKPPLSTIPLPPQWPLWTTPLLCFVCSDWGKIINHSIWPLFLFTQVTLEHMKSKKTLNFVANVWLSRNQTDGDIVCELPVMKEGEPVFPGVLLIFGSLCCMCRLYYRCLNSFLHYEFGEYFLCTSHSYWRRATCWFSVTQLA